MNSLSFASAADPPSAFVPEAPLLTPLAHLTYSLLSPWQRPKAVRVDLWPRPQPPVQLAA
jgi:hypothetical protein